MATTTLTAEAGVHHYYGPTLPGIPHESWVVCFSDEYWPDRRRETGHPDNDLIHILFTLPDLTSHQWLCAWDSDIGPEITTTTVIRRRGKPWTLAHPEEAAILEACADASLAHVQAAIVYLQPTLDRMRQILGGP